jgi:hypothetical protein
MSRIGHGCKRFSAACLDVCLDERYIDLTETTST